MRVSTNLQQQKLVWSVRPAMLGGSIPCNLQQQKLVWSVRHWNMNAKKVNIYNSRNQCGLLDTATKRIWNFYLQQQKLVWSVRLVSQNAEVIMYLQQQKLVWSVRLNPNNQNNDYIYNSRNQCGLLDGKFILC